MPGTLESFEPLPGGCFLQGFTVYEILTRQLQGGTYRARVLDVLEGSRLSIGDTRTVYGDLRAYRVHGKTKKHTEAVILMEKLQFAVNVLEDNLEGLSLEEQETYLEQLTHYGCQSGMVSGAIYTRELEQLFKDNMSALLEMADDLSDEMGEPILGQKDYTSLPQDLVWIAIETTAAEMLPDVHEKILFGDVI